MKHLALLLALLPSSAQAAECDAMTVWDPAQGMCEPYPMREMAEPMSMLMVHGNGFAVGATEGGPRGQRAISGPNMFMADLGRQLGETHYLNLDFMGTVEKWSLPTTGYPELLQIGETDSQGRPFIDAQHPHSSPIMGLTVSDTIALGTNDEKNNVKFSFAPRGETTDGPVAFMHRETGLVNPDAPLGHHIGQDVGHVTSTVLAASLKLGRFHFELSGFHGAEPQPVKVDLPIGTPDSVAARVIVEAPGAGLTAMLSAARVNAPESDQPGIAFETRYSASLYWEHPLGSWMFYDTLIYGIVTRYDEAPALSSFGEEFLFRGNAPRIWGRVEVLQRTAGELAVASAANQDSGLWIAAVTLGYTHKLAAIGDRENGVELGLGVSGTKDLLPGAFTGAYGGDPWTGKIFLQLGGMKMWDL